MKNNIEFINNSISDLKLILTKSEVRGIMTNSSGLTQFLLSHITLLEIHVSDRQVCLEEWASHAVNEATWRFKKVRK